MLNNSMYVIIACDTDSDYKWCATDCPYGIDFLIDCRRVVLAFRVAKGPKPAKKEKG
jgi:hypothetical protein